MCLNKIKDSEIENIPVYLHDAPFTKSFGYTKVYYYGDTDHKVERKEIDIMLWIQLFLVIYRQLYYGK